MCGSTERRAEHKESMRRNKELETLWRKIRNIGAGINEKVKKVFPSRVQHSKENLPSVKISIFISIFLIYLKLYYI